MDKFYKLILVFSFFANITIAQKQHGHPHRCAFTETNPHALGDAESFERWIDERKPLAVQQLQSRSSEPLRIPVIFHVVHYGEAVGTNTNLSAAQIQAQLDQLNNDFQNILGAPAGVDTGIEFLPALYDEAGGELPEPGIHRINSVSSGYGTSAFGKTYINSTIKPATQWNPTEYLNIWVCSISGGTLGFAQFPEGSGLSGLTPNGTAATDGVVVNNKSVGSVDNPSPLATGGYVNYSIGRTLVHEVGHFLGLRHIWGDGACDVDDYCADTPASDGPNFGCTATISCGTVDMIENFMDYTYDNCMSVFTADQRLRMQTVLLNSTRRVELTTSDKADFIAPLPVELLRFDVAADGDAARLDWATATETNNKEFVISHSIDGVNFKDIKKAAGAGDKQTITEYSILDRQPYHGVNYYRLTQVDFDGTTEDLGVRALRFHPELGISAHPNPMRGDDLHLQIGSQKGGDLQVWLFDLQGRELLRQSATLEEGINRLVVNVEGLDTGVYFVRCYHNGLSQTMKWQKI